MSTKVRPSSSEDYITALIYRIDVADLPGLRTTTRRRVALREVLAQALRAAEDWGEEHGRRDVWAEVAGDLGPGYFEEEDK